MAKRTISKRERLIIVVAVATFLGLFIFIPMGRGFAQDYKTTLRLASEAANTLNDIREMRHNILDERSGRRIIIDRVQARQANFDLYSYVSTTLRGLKMHNNARIQSQGNRFSGGELDVVTLNLSNVSMRQIIDLLHKVDTSGNLIVLQRLGHFRAMKNGKGLECEVVFMAPKA